MILAEANSSWAILESLRMYLPKIIATTIATGKVASMKIVSFQEIKQMIIMPTTTVASERNNSANVKANTS